MNKKVYVGNLLYATTLESFREHFSQYGEIEDIVIIMDRETGRSRGFGFITYQTEAGAKEAVEAMNGVEFEGKSLTVNFARERESGGGRSRSSGRRTHYSEG